MDKKKLKDLEQDLAKILGKPGKKPRREIAEEIASMVSTPSSIKRFKFLRTDKVLSKQKIKPTDRLTKDFEKENKVLRGLVKKIKIGEEPKFYGKVKKDPKQQNLLLKRLLKSLVKVKSKLN